MQELKQAPELISFIRPTDWMMFTCPKGINFKSLQNNLGSTVKDAVDKLNIIREDRSGELVEPINKQYRNVCLESSNELKINSVVLFRNIANERKREPFKLARVNEIKQSRDGSQRVVTVTYNNIGINKKGDFDGTPVSVERYVKDLVLVDAALNDSALSPEIQTIGQDTANTLDDLETPGVQDTSETDILHTS